MSGCRPGLIQADQLAGHACLLVTPVMSNGRAWLRRGTGVVASARFRARWGGCRQYAARIGYSRDRGMRTGYGLRASGGQGSKWSRILRDSPECSGMIWAVGMRPWACIRGHARPVFAASRPHGAERRSRGGDSAWAGRAVCLGCTNRAGLRQYRVAPALQWGCVSESACGAERRRQSRWPQPDPPPGSPCAMQ